eukprot:m.1037598 g.1037598  ORF g.1037598 m.1037598 type:complete len:76 (+) comp24145_c0_seq5:1558-1785(+)
MEKARNRKRSEIHTNLHVQTHGQKGEKNPQLVVSTIVSRSTHVAVAAHLLQTTQSGPLFSLLIIRLLIVDDTLPG